MVNGSIEDSGRKIGNKSSYLSIDWPAKETKECMQRVLTEGVMGLFI